MSTCWSLPTFAAWAVCVTAGVLSYVFTHQFVAAFGTPPAPAIRPWLLDSAGYHWAPVDGDPDGYVCVRSGRSDEPMVVRTRSDIAATIGIAAAVPYVVES